MTHLCVLEEVESHFEIVTFFRLRKSEYLKDYKLIWSREDGTPLS